MATLRLGLTMDNAAFEDRAAEVARILRVAADRVEADAGPIDFPLVDVNGNVVGTIYTEED